MSSTPLPADLRVNASRAHRRIGLRFVSVDSLSQRLDRELATCRLTVPDRNPSMPGQRVEVMLTLPGCERLLRVPTVVGAVVEGGPSTSSAMVLKLTGQAAALPGLLDRFVHDCRGVLCAEAEARGEPRPRCDMVLPGVQRPTQDDLRAPPTTARRTGQRKAVNARRRPALINLPVFKKMKLGRTAEAPVHRSSTPPGGNRLSGLNRDKAGMLVEGATRALQSGEKAQALRLLRMAVAFDPGNIKAAALLRYAENVKT